MTTTTANPAVVQTRRNRLTGTVVDVIDTDYAPQLEGHARWITICRDHANTEYHRTRRIAKYEARRPHHWCSDCSHDPIIETVISA